nr:flippase-like domain-containing protein [uncultured Corynebacterium sp.]
MKDFRVRALLTLALLVVIGFAARGHYHLFADGWDAIKKANNWYVVAACVAMLLAMVAQAEVMVVLLRSAGVTVKRSSANALGLAANAWSATFPGGPAISAAMIFREQLKWGATPVIASWYMVLSGALSGAGMAILGFGAMFFLSADVHPYSMAFTLLTLCLLAWGMNWIAKHPDSVESWLLRVLTWFNRRRNSPEDRWHDKVVGFADQLSAVRLSPARLFSSVTLSLLNWITEILCLLFVIHAVGASPAVSGVVLAFITAKLVGQAQVTPGGLGPVDAALTGMLVGVAQMGSSTAFAAVIVFRMISFLGLAIIGWLVFLWTFVRDSVDTQHFPTLRQIASGSAARGENALPGAPGAPDSAGEPDTPGTPAADTPRPPSN